jgi:O-acetylhomoserine (thiol)-lyase
MVVHPPSTSHRQASESELLEAGITPGLLRVSVGLEDLEDLEADFGAALATARGAVPVVPGATREPAPAIGVR